MPHIKVWCLPPTEEERLKELFDRMVKAVVSIEELELKDENDMLICFPADMMQYGIGTEIMVEVSELWDKPKRTSEVRETLAYKLGLAVEISFPDAIVAVRLDPPFKQSDGFWTNKI